MQILKTFILLYADIKIEEKITMGNVINLELCESWEQYCIFSGNVSKTYREL